MKTALSSDVHGNAVALEAVLADLERRPVDQVVALGSELEVAFRRVPVDVGALVGAVLASGMPGADAVAAHWRPR